MRGETTEGAVPPRPAAGALAEVVHAAKFPVSGTRPQRTADEGRGSRRGPGRRLPTMELDTTDWSGEGAFTQTLIDAVRGLDQVTFVRVEDARSSRSDVDYNFISNEVFVRFRTRDAVRRTRVLGLLPVTRTVAEPAMTVTGLEQALGRIEQVGPPDYADDGMLQYLRTERVVPPYQTRGYKLVELVRIYEAGTAPRPDDHA